MQTRLKSIIVLALFATTAPVVAQDTKEMTDMQKTSYAIGVQFGRAIAAGAELLDKDALMTGLDAAMSGDDLKITDEDMSALLVTFQRDMKEKLVAKVRSEGETFLVVNAQKKGVVVLDSGLQYKVITEGTGASPKATDSVTTHYEGSLTDGTVFDSSYKRGEPATFPVNRVIPGWTEALQLMKEGSKWELYIPYNLAYGEQGSSPRIPPFAALVFTVELIKIEKS